MKAMFQLVAVALVSFVALTACRQGTAESVATVKADATARTLEDLRHLSGEELSALFAQGVATPIPSQANPGVAADGAGLPIILPGDLIVSSFANQFWGGKIFTTDPTTGATTLVNKLLNNSQQMIDAKVYAIPSSISTKDGKPSILLDYGASNVVLAQSIRDEIRAIGPGLYLGRANVVNSRLAEILSGEKYRFVIWFALSFSADQ